MWTVLVSEGFWSTSKFFLHNLRYHFLRWNQIQSASTHSSYPFIIFVMQQCRIQRFALLNINHNSKLLVCNTTTSGNWKRIDNRQINQAYYVCTWNEEDGSHIESFRKTNMMTTLLSFSLDMEFSYTKNVKKIFMNLVWDLDSYNHGNIAKCLLAVPRCKRKTKRWSSQPGKQR
jgi:hypothetical protein